MNNIFTICYSEEEANEIGHFIMRKGYEGVQNDSYRYCREAIRWAFRQAKRHHSNCIYIGVRGCQMIVSKNKRRLRRNRLKYIVLYAEKKLYQSLRLMQAISAITVMLSKRIHPKEKGRKTTRKNVCNASSLKKWKSYSLGCPINFFSLFRMVEAAI